VLWLRRYERISVQNWRGKYKMNISFETVSIIELQWTGCNVMVPTYRVSYLGISFEVRCLGRSLCRDYYNSQTVN